MLIGHLGAGMALRQWSGDRRSRLGPWFAAVLFADLACFALSMLGIEKFEYAPWFVRHFPYRLLHAPFTHSLAGAVASGLLAAIGARAFGLGARAAALLGVAVFSHFPLDIIVHGPDMAWAFEPPHLGFGLWHVPWASEALELILLAAGSWVWLRSEPQLWGRSFRVFLGGLLVAELAPSLAPPIPDPFVAACTGLLTMSFLVAWGHWGVTGVTFRRERAKPHE